MFDQAKAYYKKLVPGLREEDWNVMQEKFTIQKLKKGELLIRNGEICRQVCFINKGLLRMFYVVDPREIRTSFINENEYISQYDSFLTKQPSAGYIDALEDCEPINLSYDDGNNNFTCSKSYATVKGTITNKVIEKPLEGASVTIEGNSLSALTNANGFFILKHVPVGRIKINISFIGYQAGFIPEVLVTTGKEVVLDIGFFPDILYRIEF
jgi:hypothetical protein